MMPKIFGDKPEDWRSWKEDVLDWVNAHKPGVKDILEEVAKWEEWDEMNLVNLLEDKPDWVRNDRAQLWAPSIGSPRVRPARW